MAQLVLKHDDGSQTTISIPENELSLLTNGVVSEYGIGKDEVGNDLGLTLKQIRMSVAEKMVEELAKNREKYFQKMARRQAESQVVVSTDNITIDVKT